ncbi:MAG: response regulator [Pyrinomonadaceae bacterium]
MATRLDYVPTILLVEDDEDARAELKQMLQRSGYRVVDTDNGRDAATGARYARPDLLFVDLDVPLLYELTAARRIVQQARLGQLPVVLITHGSEAEEYPLEANVRRNEYVTRLADYEQLEHLLEYLLPTGPAAA